MTTQTTYEVITQEDPETGDLYITLPPELLQTMGWNEGDTIEWNKGEGGEWFLSKSNK